MPTRRRSSGVASGMNAANGREDAGFAVLAHSLPNVKQLRRDPLDEFPNLRFVFYEAGAQWMTYVMLGCDRSFYIERGCSRTSTPPSELIKQHCMTAVESLEPLEQLVEAFGSDNFIIGSDFPHPEFQFLPNSTSDITDKPRLSDEDKAKILGGNLARQLKL